MNDENSFCRRHSTGRTVLVTDANSVVGQAVLDRLVDTGSAGRWTAITLADGDRPPPPGVQVVHGALAAPRLGLLPSAYKDLALGVDAVVYTGPVPVGRQIDTALGRQISEVLTFAEHADAPLYFVGTASTQGRVGGSGETLRPKTGWEDLVGAAGRRLIVLRPSLVLGDSRTGATTSFPAAYRIVDALLDGGVRSIAANPAALLDFVPCDVVADVIVRLIAAGVRSGDYWLTAGELALTIEQVLDVLAEHAAEQHLAFRRPRLDGPGGTGSGFGHRPHRPPSADGRPGSSTPARWIQGCVTADPLETSLGDRFSISISELGGLGVGPLPDARETLAASLRYWARAADEHHPERALA